MKKKGKLPVTDFIKLNSDEAQWSLLAEGLINDFETKGVISKGERSMRISVLVTKAYTPDMIIGDGRIEINSNLDQDFSIGMSRLYGFLHSFLDKQSWLLLGHIQGENEVPIIIMHLDHLGLTLYSQKLPKDDKDKFLPNPNLN